MGGPHIHIQCQQPKCKPDLSAPNISHLFFVDDSLLFCKATTSEVSLIKDTLDDYCFLSGQLVNYDKYAAYFIKGTCNIKKRELAKILGVKLMTGNER